MPVPSNITPLLTVPAARRGNGSAITTAPVSTTPLGNSLKGITNTSSIPCITLVQALPQQPYLTNHLENIRQATPEECAALNQAVSVLGPNQVPGSSYLSSFTGHQRVNQVLRWVSVAALAANEFCNPPPSPPKKYTPEIQAAVLPGAKILLGQNEDNPNIPEALWKAMSDEKTFSEITGKINARLNNGPEAWEIRKLTQRLNHIESLYCFINNREKADEFISLAIRECHHEALASVTKAALEDLRIAFQTNNIRMATSPLVANRTQHAEQRVIETITVEQTSIYDAMVNNWGLKPHEWQAFPIFIAGGKPPCLSCQTIENARDKYARATTDPSITKRIHMVRAEDGQGDGKSQVGEAFRLTHMSAPQEKILNSSDFSNKHAVVNNDSSFTRRLSVSNPISTTVAHQHKHK